MADIFQRVYTEHIGFVTTDVLPAMARYNDKRGALIQIAANMFPTFQQVTFANGEGPNIRPGMLYTYEPNPERMGGVKGQSPLLVMQPKERDITLLQQTDSIARAKCLDGLLFAMMQIGAIRNVRNDPGVVDGGFAEYLFQVP